MESHSVPVATSDGTLHGINAGDGEDAKPGHGNGMRYEEGEHEDTLDDLMVLSPAHRVREKAPTPLGPKRSQKYCQKDDCVFSRGEPGKPARKATDQEYCAWCDEKLLAQALQAAGTECNLKVSPAFVQKE